MLWKFWIPWWWLKWLWRVAGSSRSSNPAVRSLLAGAGASFETSATYIWRVVKLWARRQTWLRRAFEGRATSIFPFAGVELVALFRRPPYKMEARDLTLWLYSAQHHSRVWKNWILCLESCRRCVYSRLALETRHEVTGVDLPAYNEERITKTRALARTLFPHDLGSSVAICPFIRATRLWQCVHVWSIQSL